MRGREKGRRWHHEGAAAPPDFALSGSHTIVRDGMSRGNGPLLTVFQKVGEGVAFAHID